MTIALAWLVFPLRPGALSLGCGLLARAGVGAELPAAAPPARASLSSSWRRQFADDERRDRTARHAARRRTRGRRGRSLARRRSAARRLATRCVGGSSRSTQRRSCSPGSATFAGYITLDDTATWLALLDRAMPRPEPRRACTLDLRGDARRSACARLPARRVPATRRRPRADRPGRRLALPADIALTGRADRLSSLRSSSGGSSRRARCAPSSRSSARRRRFSTATRFGAGSRRSPPRR